MGWVVCGSWSFVACSCPRDALVIPGGWLGSGIIRLGPPWWPLEDVPLGYLRDPWGFSRLRERMRLYGCEGNVFGVVAWTVPLMCVSRGGRFLARRAREVGRVWS